MATLYVPGLLSLRAFCLCSNAHAVQVQGSSLSAHPTSTHLARLASQVALLAKAPPTLRSQVSATSGHAPWAKVWIKQGGFCECGALAPTQPAAARPVFSYPEMAGPLAAVAPFAVVDGLSLSPHLDFPPSASGPDQDHHQRDQRGIADSPIPFGITEWCRRTAMRLVWSAAAAPQRLARQQPRQPVTPTLHLTYVSARRTAPHGAARLLTPTEWPPSAVVGARSERYYTNAR